MASSSGGEIFSGEDDDGQFLAVGLLIEFFKKFEARHVGQPEIEHQAIVRVLLDRLDGFCPG